MALHESLTEAATRPLVTCPLCGQQYLVARDYKAHLDESHRLTDDAGTDTELSLLPPAPPPEPDPEPASDAGSRSRWGRSKPVEKVTSAEAEPEVAPVLGPPAPPRPKPAGARSPRPERPRRTLPKVRRPSLPSFTLPSLPKLKAPGPLTWPSWARRSPWAPWSTLRLDPTGPVPLVRLPSRAGLRRPGTSWLRLPAIDAGGRYPLALRFGDVALYVPGALFVLAGLFGRGPDTMSLTLSVLGSVLVLVGMLLPTLHRRTLDRPPVAPAAARPEPQPHGRTSRPLEELLLSLPSEPVE